MTEDTGVPSERVDALYARLDREAEASGYHLNPDREFTRSLVEALLVNEVRYGYWACPCRLAAGDQRSDLDIVCPCDYRDPDVEEHGFCYCALYVRKDVHELKTPIKPIPERRPMEKQMRAYTDSPETPKKTQETAKESEKQSTPRMKLYYCRQCGYVCFREEPPYVCPICKAKKEMFAELTATTQIHESPS